MSVDTKLKTIGSTTAKNQNDVSTQETLKKLWNDNHTVVQEQFTASKPVYGVYSKYKNGSTSEFTYSLCQKTDNDDYDFDIDGQFVQYQVASDDPQAIASQWENIKQDEEDGLLKRKYAQDVEIHNPDGKIDIKLGITF